MTVVIVIPGTLAAAALSRFIDMRDAQQTAISGVAGAAASAMAVNFSGCTLTNQIDIAGECVPSMTCAKVGAIIQGGSTGHVPTDTSPACTVTAGGFCGPFAGI